MTNVALIVHVAAYGCFAADGRAVAVMIASQACCAHGQMLLHLITGINCGVV